MGVAVHTQATAHMASEDELPSQASPSTRWIWGIELSPQLWPKVSLSADLPPCVPPKQNIELTDLLEVGVLKDVELLLKPRTPAPRPEALAPTVWLPA